MLKLLTTVKRVKILSPIFSIEVFFFECLMLERFVYMKFLRVLMLNLAIL